MGQESSVVTSRNVRQDFHIVEAWAFLTVFAYFLMALARADFFRSNDST